MPNPKITFYVDIVSPFAYLAFYALNVRIDGVYTPPDVNESVTLPTPNMFVSSHHRLV